MDELDVFCARMLGDRQAGAAVARAAREAGGDDRLARLAHAVRDCRTHAQDRAEAAGVAGDADAPVAPVTDGDGPTAPATDGRGLVEAVAAELASASARLSHQQREVLALRELLRLSHDQLALVTGVDRADIAPLLAWSRLRLRAELRGGAAREVQCPQHERALLISTLRQDREPVSSEEDDWLIDHLGHCADCSRAHAAMLEASVCYRGWRAPAPLAAG
jgi:hypothetical protein